MANKTEASDQISELPPFIIHHIMSYLSTKEVVRTGLLSKTWYHTWASYPILDFDQTHFVGKKLASEDPKNFSERQREQFRESIGKFIRFVDHSLRRFQELKFSMQKFRLFISIVDVELCSVVDKWIELAIESGVKQFALSIQTDTNVYTLPQRVFSAKSINTLQITGCNGPQPFGRYDIQCHSLEKLTLERVHLNEEMVRKLTTECPLLEDFALKNCRGFKCFDVSELVKLKTIRLFSFELESIKIAAPSLQYCYLYLWKRTSCVINMVGCQNLKLLRLAGAILTDQEFHNLISTFPLLENLSVHYCRNLKRLRISSERLKKLSLSSAELEEVTIDTANLISLNYCGCQVPPRIYLINAPCQWLVSFSYGGSLDTLWCHQLKKFLGAAGQIAKLNLSIMAEENLSNLDKSRENSPSLPCEVAHLNLRVVSPVPIYPGLVDDLLWICYPKILSVVVSHELENHFFRWLYKELKKRDVSCCSSKHIKCWRHYLKDIKIENFERLGCFEYNEPFSHDTLMDAQSTPPSGIIHFSLEWCLHLE